MLYRLNINNFLQKKYDMIPLMNYKNASSIFFASDIGVKYINNVNQRRTSISFGVSFFSPLIKIRFVIVHGYIICILL